MKTVWPCVGVMVVCVAGFGVARACVAQDVPATPATGPAAPAPPTEAAMELLKALESAGDKFTAIRADIVYTVFNPTLGDKETRTGYVLYVAAKGDNPARFRIHFQTRQEGDGPRIKDEMEYAFDGKWFNVKDHANKKLQQIQVAAPGEKVEPLRLGKGPFPLPFGQKVDDVLEFFHPVTRDPLPSDPPNTRYLKLTPKPGKSDQVNFTEVEQWMDKETYLPVKLIAKEKNKTVTTVLFGKREGDKLIIDTKPAIKDSDFTLSRPTGWQLEIIRMDEKK